MPYLEPTSGGLNRNHHLTGSMWGDIKHELGISWREDEVKMGWREPDEGGFVRGAVGFGANFMRAMCAGAVKGNFG